MTLKLHHLNASRSQRIVWLLLELGVPHEIVHHTRDQATRRGPADLAKVHPLGKSPLLEDDAVVIAETGAIAEYLLAKFDTVHALHPKPDSPDFPRYLEWLLALYTGMAGVTEGPVAHMIAAEREKAASYIEAHLSKHAYFAGAAFSAADCLMGFQIAMTGAQGGLANRPATKAWLDKVTARPAYQAMLAVGV